MATRRRKKITTRYAELLKIPPRDRDKIAKSFARLARMTPTELGIGFIDTRDGRGAPIKASVHPNWVLNMAVLIRLAEVAGGDAQDRARFLYDLGVWRETLPPSAGAVKRYRDRWRDQDRIDDVILAAWRDLRAGRRITHRAVT
jgi:hypothetical protein